jgi:predicted DNA-binding WGR domain protein
MREPCIDPEQKAWRFYAASVQPTLLGTFALVREWGRVGSPGRVQTQDYPREEEAEAALVKLRQAKERRGYLDAAEESATE